MINEKQPFHLRNTILYAFECYLHKNDEKKAEIVDTLLPNNTDQHQQPQTLKSGHLLCNGLFNQADWITKWLSAVALAHTINENVQLKERLLRVQLAVNVGGGGNSNGEVRAVPLMQQCMMILNEVNVITNAGAAGGVGQTNGGEKSKFKTTIAILMFIATWLANCSAAVNQFLTQEQNIPYVRFKNIYREFNMLEYNLLNIF